MKTKEKSCPIISASTLLVLLLIFISSTASASASENASRIDTDTNNITEAESAGNNSTVSGQFAGTLQEPILPSANFSTDVTAGPAPLTVQFTDLSKNATGWNWDFGDGTFSTERNPTHTFDDNGANLFYPPGYPTSYHWVTLTATNGNGSDNKYEEIDILTPVRPFGASFVGSPDEHNPLSIQFTDTSVYGELVFYQWDFGDGTTSSEANPFHTYASAGNYTVTLMLGGEWTESKASEVISIVDLKTPVADFSASPVCGNAPLTVAFTDKSAGLPTAWKWCFGDGTSSTNDNPVHTYSKEGKYNVVLTVKNTKGNNEVTKCHYIVVKPPLKSNVACKSHIKGTNIVRKGAKKIYKDTKKLKL